MREIGSWPTFWLIAVIMIFAAYLVPPALARRGWIARGEGKKLPAFVVAATLVLAVAGGFYAIASDSELRRDASTEAASLVALGLLAGGVLFGFLFALPKVVEAPTPAANAADPSARLRANTNLEKVSDWLTTVITGLTLTQLVRIPDYLERFSYYLATGFASRVPTTATPTAPTATVSQSLVATALGIIIHFPIVGFLGGYIGTRTILTRTFDAADRGLIDDDKKRTVDKTPQLLELPDPSSDDKPTADQLAAARDIASVDPATLTTVDEIAGYARALTILGRPHDAVPWFQRALQITPNDERLLEQYAAALYADPQSDSWEIVPILKRALSLVPKDDAKSRARVSTNLVLTYLYVPDGFLNALELANAMDADKTIEKRPILFFYRACALGQLYTALKAGRTFRPPVLADTTAVEDAIRADTNLALRLQPALRGRFLYVATPHATQTGGDEPEDDDLVEFAKDHPDYLAALQDGAHQ